MPIYHLCPSCAVVASNADTSALDPEDELRGVTAWLEAAGLLVHTGQKDEGGYWDCDACGWTQIGDPAQLYEAV